MDTKEKGQHKGQPKKSQINHTTTDRETHQAVEASIKQLLCAGGVH